jgi:hypothetical protein
MRQTTTTKYANSAEGYAREVINQPFRKAIFQNKQTRDEVFKILKAHTSLYSGFKVRRGSVKFQQLHPEYINDFVGTYEIGFGNSDYMRLWTVLYTVEVVTNLSLGVKQALVNRLIDNIKETNAKR